jgi:predicted MFS family arabinose efflux permease
MGGNFLFGMLGNMLATPLSRLLKKRYALASAIFQGTWGAAVFLLALQTSPLPATALFWLAYVNMSVVNSPHNALLNQQIPASQRSAMLSIASLASYAGAMAGGAALGYVAEHVSINAAWIISGVVLMVSLSLFLRVDLRQATSRLPEELHAGAGT